MKSIYGMGGMAGYTDYDMPTRKKKAERYWRGNPRASESYKATIGSASMVYGGYRDPVMAKHPHGMGATIPETPMEQIKGAGQRFYKWWATDTWDNNQRLKKQGMAKRDARRAERAKNPAVYDEMARRKRKRSDLFHPFTQLWTSTGGASTGW